MIIKFDTRIEGLGDALCTDGASREDLEGFCVALADAFNRLKKEHDEAIEAMPWLDIKHANHLSLVEKLSTVILHAKVDWADATVALITALGAALASNEQLPARGIDALAKKAGREIGERARAYRRSELGQFFQSQRPH